MISTKIILPALALTLSGSLYAASARPASAFDLDEWKTNFVQSLSTKLGISQDKVEVSLEEIRTEQRAQKQSRFEDRLSELVQLGKITEAQKTALMNKHAELQKEWEAQRAKREEHRQELENWATEQGIDLSVLGGFGGPGMGGRGMGIAR